MADFNFKTFTNTINGEQRSTETTRRAINPATTDELAPVPVSTEKDLDDAVKAARAAFKSWKLTTIEDRKERLLKFADAINAHKDEFAAQLTQEQGKPLMFASAEIDSAVEWIQATVTLDLNDEIIEDKPEKLVKTRHLPLGVVVAIVPWNFPILLLVGKLAPALYSGCTIIIKPSPFTPYGGLKIAELAQQFFPAGVVQALSGDDSLGPLMTAHPDIDKISFTGSTATGKLVMQSASKNLTRVTLELGGNDPAIVCGDVDINTVAPALSGLAFLNSGQICVAVKRIFVHESIYDQFKAVFVAAVESFKTGNGADEGVFLGPIQNKQQYERIKTFLTDARDKDQTIATGGNLIGTGTTGYYIQPTVIDAPADDSKIVVEEPFGPIVPLLKWSTEEEVIQRANNTNMGLGASVWSANVDNAVKIAEQIEAGSVWINEHLGISPLAAFTGHKQSGVGSEWGKPGLLAYTIPQTIYINRPKATL